MNITPIDTVQNTLDILHKDAKKDIMRIGKGLIKSAFRPIQPIDFEHAYLPISKDQGKTIQQLIIKHNCKTIVEFGTSFGISTIYMADAAQKTKGKVITTELLKSKAKTAINNINKAGLSKYVDVRIGDAMQTLKADSEAIDFLFLDGWKDLYLPLFKMLKPRFKRETLIYADNMDMSGTQNFAKYIREHDLVYSVKVMNNGKAYLIKFI